MFEIENFYLGHTAFLVYFQITDYANTCMRSCRILARLFAIALGQEPTYFEKPGFFDNPTCLLGMNFYHFEG